MKIRLLMPLVGLVLGTTFVSAHHSFSSEFDEHNPVKLVGAVTRFDLVNPHVWVYMDVKNPDGTVANWAVEAGSVNQMFRRGLRKADFPVGSQVTVDGYRAKNGKNMANGRTVTFLDGRNFFLGAPEGAPSNAAGR